MNSTQGQKYFKSDWITQTSIIVGAAGRVVFCPITGFTKFDDLAYYSRLRVTVQKTAADVTLTGTNGATGHFSMASSKEEITAAVRQAGSFNTNLDTVAPCYFGVVPSGGSNVGINADSAPITNTVATNASFFDGSATRSIVFECGGVQGYPVLLVGCHSNSTGDQTFSMKYRIEGWA